MKGFPLTYLRPLHDRSRSFLPNSPTPVSKLFAIWSTKTWLEAIESWTIDFHFCLRYGQFALFMMGHQYETPFSFIADHFATSETQNPINRSNLFLKKTKTKHISPYLPNNLHNLRIQHSRLALRTQMVANHRPSSHHRFAKTLRRLFVFLMSQLSQCVRLVSVTWNCHLSVFRHTWWI